MMHTSTATLTETLVLPMRQAQQALDECKDLPLETDDINTLPISATLTELAADLSLKLTCWWCCS